MSRARVLGVDPGLAKFGYAIVDIERDVGGALALAVVRMGTLVTKKTTQKITDAEDKRQRAQELCRELHAILARHRPDIVSAEAFSYPMTSQAAAMLGRAWGIIDTLCSMNGLPLVQLSPQALKKAVIGKTSASKDAMQEALRRAFTPAGGPCALDAVGAERLNKRTAEHAYDALASVVAAQHSELIKASLR